MMQAAELAVLDWLQAHLRCDFLDAVMPWISRICDHGEIWILLAAVLLLLRKHRWTGMSLSFALILDLICCNIVLKPLVGRVRPFLVNTAVELLTAPPADASFPSGHTATAFVTATILHREYGHLHPLVSIGGYTAAAATGILRIRKNRHWASDVAAGAGIGILATELGYCITDALFRDKGLDITGREDIISNRGYKPSFVGIRTGFNVPLGNFRLNDMLDFRTSGGYCAAVEGAYFVNTHIGIGGKIGTASCNIVTNGRQAEPDRLELLNASAGVYASCPVSKRWLAGTKLTAGFVHYGNLYLVSQTVDGGNGFGAGTGLSFTFRARKDMSVCFSADYDLLPPVSKSGGQYFHMLTLGVATAWNF